MVSVCFLIVMVLCSSGLMWFCVLLNRHGLMVLCSSGLMWFCVHLDWCGLVFFLIVMVLCFKFIFYFAWSFFILFIFNAHIQ
jgi:hypothetical protein